MANYGLEIIFVIPHRRTKTLFESNKIRVGLRDRSYGMLDRVSGSYVIKLSLELTMISNFRTIDVQFLLTRVLLDHTMYCFHALPC